MVFQYFHKLLIHQSNDKPGTQSRYIVYISEAVAFLSAYVLIHAENDIPLH